MKKHKTPPVDYYKSSHWKSFIKKLWETEDRCEICGALRWKINKDGTKYFYRRKFSVHHKHYRTLWREKREDVQCLCSRCHDLYHEIVRMKDTSSAIHELKETAKKYFFYEVGE